MKRLALIAALAAMIAVPASAQVFNPPLDGPTTLVHTNSVTDNNVTIAGQYLVSSAVVTTNSCTTTCFLEIWDSATVPADGNYTGNGPGFCYPIPTDTLSNPWKGANMANIPEVPRSNFGVTVVVNSGADCYHLTKVPAYISIQVQ